MIETIDLFINESSANIKQTRLKRDWMDETWDSHAYHCFPMSLANTIGYEISFPEEISFVWNGKDGSESENVTILSGEKYASNSRGNATVSFNTGLVFKTSENLTMLSMPVPNLFVDGAQAFTTLVSSSFVIHPIPVAWKVTRPNQVITIPANQPIITIVPVPLKQIASIEMNMYSGKYKDGHGQEVKEYGEAAQVFNQKGEWTDWYRKGVNHKGQTIGKHELKSIKLKINDFTDQERIIT